MNLVTLSNRSKFGRTFLTGLEKLSELLAGSNLTTLSSTGSSTLTGFSSNLFSDSGTGPEIVK
jgi:hypothetical protein